MKKQILYALLTVILCLTIVLSLAACDNETETKTADDGTTTAAPDDSSIVNNVSSTPDEDESSAPAESISNTPNEDSSSMPDTDDPSASEEDDTSIPDDGGNEIPSVNYTDGMEYRTNPDMMSYSLIGIGTAHGKEIIIPSEYNGLPVTKIASSAFYSLEIECVVISEGITEIAGTAFRNCKYLTDIVLPNTLQSIGEGAFNGCDSLVYTTFENADYLGNENNPYLYLAKVIDQTVTPVSIAESTKIIGAEAFASCSELQSISIPNSVTTIGARAFYGCTALERVTLGCGVSRIQPNAFLFCDALQELHITDLAAWCRISFEWNDAYFTPRQSSNPLYYAKKLFLNGELVTDLVIPEGITEIQPSAFCNAVSLQTVTMPNSVTSIGQRAFSGCSSLTSITIPDGVTSIDSDAFSGCTNLTGIHISDIAAWCNIEFYISNGICTSPLSYAHNLYLNDVLVTDLTIPDSVTSINACAFYGCTSLASITIPEGVTSIDVYAFYGCTALTDITIPDGVTSIGAEAFYGCTSLTSITIPDSVTSIDRYAFYGCANLIQSENGVSYVDKWVVDCDSSVTNVELRSNTAGIGAYALYYCSSLTSITIPDSVTSIGRYAFSQSSNLTNVYYTGTAEEWDAISISSSGNSYLTSATRYYYSKTAPTTSGNYWHYVDGVPTAW